MTDIVVDTNVFMHADDPRNAEVHGAAEFVEALLASVKSLCVDENMDENEALNSSMIWHEYKEHLAPTGLSYAILVELVKTGRVLNVSRSVSSQHRRLINQNVSDRTDRVFVQVARNSDSKMLISSDQQAFHRHCSRKLRQGGVCEVYAPAAAEI